jgi:hypothetical protein
MMDEEEKEKSPAAIGVSSGTIKTNRFHFR